MHWEPDEIKALSPILEQIRLDLEPLAGKRLLVLCSAAGQVAFFLAENNPQVEITGLELDAGLLERARQAARRKGLAQNVHFQPADMNRIPLPAQTFDALVSEFVVYPTPAPTQIGQPEMARLLKPGGRMAITDVIVTVPIPPKERAQLAAIGLDYLCEGTVHDFRGWMQAAGLVDIEARDLTPVVRAVWEQRRGRDPAAEHQAGYALLLDRSPLSLGEGIFYIYVQGAKPGGSQ